MFNTLSLKTSIEVYILTNLWKESKYTLMHKDKTRTTQTKIYNYLPKTRSILLLEKGKIKIF